MAYNKTNTFEYETLMHIFANAAITGIGDSSGLPASSTEGSIYIGLLKDTIDEEQGTPVAGVFPEEADYTGYARVAVPRNTSAGWTITKSSTTTGGVPDGSTETTSGALCTNKAAITFAPCTSGTSTITHIGIFKRSISETNSAGNNAGDLIIAGKLNTALAVSSGVTPQFAINAIQIYEY